MSRITDTMSSKKLELNIKKCSINRTLNRKEILKLRVSKQKKIT